MKTIKLSIICDSVLSGFIIFFIARVTLRTILHSFAATVILSIVFALSFSAAIFILLYKANGKKNVKKSEEKRIAKILSELELMPDNRLIALFIPIFNKVGKPYIVHSDGIETDDSFYCFDYNAQTERQSAVEKIRRADGKKVILLCGSPSAECISFCKKHSDRIVCADKTIILQLEKEYGILFPTQTQAEKKPLVTRLITKIYTLATLRRAAAFAFLGAGIIMFSKVSFYPKWYTFCGITLLVFSAFLAVIRIIIGITNTPSEVKSLF